MIRPMVVVFVLLEVNITLGGDCGICVHWRRFKQVKCLQSCSKILVSLFLMLTQGNEDVRSVQDFIIFILL